jgi:hypothetical protein
MLWTTEAPARSETMATTEDHPSEGVPVGCFPAPNFLLILDFRNYQWILGQQVPTSSVKF